ncbi:hypothetical protein SAMN05192544_10273 [Paraburkholderia hospita]|nr:hypothetical protein SAMN05192544_10273 [Paraburkholderia hospita]
MLRPPTGSTGRLGELKLDRALSLSLNSLRPRQNLIAVRNIADSQTDKITTSELAVDCKVEQGEIADRMSVLTYRPIISSSPCLPTVLAKYPSVQNSPPQSVFFTCGHLRNISRAVMLLRIDTILVTLYVGTDCTTK